MLTAVEVTAEQPGVAALNLLIAGSEDSAIQVKKIDGLDPVRASVTSAPYGAFDGEVLGSPSVGKRNIVFTLGLNPDWATQTMEELRQLLYTYFMPKSTVVLEFTSTHLPTCQISGVVEDMVPNMFSADPEIMVSILCGDPDFVAVAQTVVNGVVVTDNSFTVINYIGTKPTGFNLTVKSAAANVEYLGGTLTLRSLWNELTTFVVTAISITAAQFFEMNSVPREKYVRKVTVPGGVITNEINKISGIPVWPQLKPGANSFAVQAAEAGQDWTLSYFARFGGL